jgi:hypothetical protein
VGRLVHASGDLIGKIEKAERWPSTELITARDTVLDAGGALNSYRSELERQRGLKIGRKDAETQPASEHRVEPLVGSSGCTELLDTEGVLMMTTADESARHGQRAGHSNVGDDQLESALRRIAVDVLTAPVIPLVLDTRHIRDEAFGALEGRQHPRQSRRLYAIGARACGLLAGIAADRFGRYEAAYSHARVASGAADLAEDPVLAAWTASVRSAITFWQGQYRTAATIAHEAQAAAPAGVEVARLASLEARAWAKVGNRDAMNDALDAANVARDQDGPSAGVGVIAYPRSNQVRIAGTAYLWIGDNAKARSHLAQAISLLGEEYDSPPHVAAARTDLALAHLRAEALDDAAEVLHALLAARNADRHLGGAARRVEGLVQELRAPRYVTSRMARQLVGKIEEFRIAQTSNGEAVRAGVSSQRVLPR